MAAFDARVVVLALRIAQAILAVIVLGLTAYGMITLIYSWLPYALPLTP